MPKLRIMSDLHLEFGPLDLEPIGEDVLVLAGDIGIGTQGAHWAIAYGQRTGVPTVMIAGNHEFYHGAIEDVLMGLRNLATVEPLFTFLEDDVATVFQAGVTFVGSTLWTDFRLYGEAQRYGTMRRARFMMNDYRMIDDGDGPRLTPEKTVLRHEFSAGILRERLPRRYVDGPCVVMTHHLPSARSIPNQYADDLLNAAYASHLDDLVANSGAALWVHGHTHSSVDYRIGDTRVVCNPRGYYPHDLNPDFNPNLVIEV